MLSHTSRDDIATMCSTFHQSFVTKCKGCNHIKNIWYGFLKDTGFEDIEKPNTKTLDPVYQLAKKIDFQEANVFEVASSYYTWAESQTDFRSEKDKILWEYHAQGYTGRKIAKTVGNHHSCVARRIKRIESYLTKKTG